MERKIVLEYESGSVYALLSNSTKQLLDNVSFNIPASGSLVLIGETGSGKTMSALSIMGLLPPNVRSQGGKCVLSGKNLPESYERRSLLGRKIAYIPQNGLEFLNPSSKIQTQLYDSLRISGFKKNELRSEAEKRILAVGLKNPRKILSSYPFQLSGGMAQRVTIALAACSSAELLIADEPTNGLDKQAKNDFIQMLNSLFSNSAKLIITHDISVAALFDDILVLCGGKPIEHGKKNEVLQNPHHPYTKTLIDALVENGMRPSPQIRSQIGECPFYTRCTYAGRRCESDISVRQERGRTWRCFAE